MTVVPPPVWTDVGSTLRELAARHGGRDALVSADARLGFADLVESVDRAMGLLVREGWAPGMSAGVAVRDAELHLAVTFALLSLGSPSVVLPSHETEAAIRSSIEKLDVRLVVHDGWRDWMTGLRAIEVTPSKLARAGSGMGHAVGSPGASPALFIRTSGSTSAPKIFAMSYARLARAAIIAGSEPRERRVMRLATMEFDSTRSYRVYGVLGGNAAILPPDDRSELGQVCARLDVSQVHVGTYVLQSILNGGRAPARLPQETELLTGGSRVPGAFRAEIAERLTDKLWISYATSEIGVISFARPEEHAAYPEGVGHPRPEAEVEIVDDDGRPVEPGAVGEIRARRPANPTAYIGQNPDPAASQFRDGWFYPRDLISRPPGGPLIFHGRADDVMLLAGIKVSGAAIEDALHALPAISEAVAFPIRSRAHGEIPAAAVVLSPGDERPAAADLLAHCRATLGVRAPRRIVILDEIPRTATGKPIKRALAEL